MGAIGLKKGGKEKKAARKSSEPGFASLKAPRQ
jgi:hypothetical protein